MAVDGSLRGKARPALVPERVQAGGDGEALLEEVPNEAVGERGGGHRPSSLVGVGPLGASVDFAAQQDTGEPGLQFTLHPAVRKAASLRGGADGPTDDGAHGAAQRRPGGGPAQEPAADVPDPAGLALPPRDGVDHPRDGAEDLLPAPARGEGADLPGDGLAAVGRPGAREGRGEPRRGGACVGGRAGGLRGVCGPLAGRLRGACGAFAGPLPGACGAPAGAPPALDVSPTTRRVMVLSAMSQPFHEFLLEEGEALRAGDGPLPLAEEEGDLGGGEAVKEVRQFPAVGARRPLHQGRQPAVAGEAFFGASASGPGRSA